MRYRTCSHRHARTLFKSEEPYLTLWGEIAATLEEISDDDIVALYTTKYQGKMSISWAVNDLINERLTALGWTPQSPIFADPKYSGGRETRWRLDFAKSELSVEVAFNHGEASAWNLLKPVLASELNHVQKAIQTSAGVLIAATESLKAAGGFDGAVGTYESFVRYLPPLNNVLTVPVLLVGLDAPSTFRIETYKVGNRRSGRVISLLT
jgi:hypothetical protein